MNKRAGLSTEFVAMEFIKKKRSREDSDKPPDKRVRINVGGTLFETWRSTLERIPGTRLALMAVLGESDDTWDKEKKEFFFDRHPGVFSMVMQYYRTEELHTDQNFCGNIIQGELDFWGLTELDIEPCCWGQYSKFKDHRETLAALDENFTQQTEMEAWTEKTTNYERFKHRVWQFIEEPSTSRAAKLYAVFSMFFVVLSIAIFCLETYHWFRVPIPGAKSHNATGYDTYFAPTGDQCIKTKHKTGQYEFSATEPHPAMTYLDYVCAAYFTIEYLTRFFFAPGKWKFIKGPLNVIDLLCLIPHLIAIIMVTVDPYGSSKDTSNLFRAFLALRTVRILRIFKLMKHYSAFKILVYTIKVSTKELLLLVIFLFTGVLIFASIIFYTENDTFDSIPVGFWWALVTMTTVGYGDKVPRTEGGYIIGCVCVLCGVLTVAFTVPIVVNNFTLYYSHAQSRIKLPVHKRKELKRKIFLKNQKSLEFLQKLKWRRGKHNTQFSDLDTPQTPRDPPCGQEAADEVTTPPKTSRVTLLVGTDDDNSASAALFHKNAPSPTIVDEMGRASGSHHDDADKSHVHSGRNNPPHHTNLQTSDRNQTPVERILSPVERMPSSSDRFQITPERIHTVSESINFSITDSMSFSVPGTPSDASMNTEQHIAETEQLLHDLADADKKRKDERKRQLSLINQKRENRRQQINTEPKKPPVSEGGSSKSTC